MTKVKAYELRSQSKDALLKQLDELKLELSRLRVAKVTGGAAAKIMKIKQVRKSIARVLTVYNAKSRESVRELCKGKKYQPKEIRAKKTRAMRRALSDSEKKKVTVKSAKKAKHFPVRKFAIKA